MTKKIFIPLFLLFNLTLSYAYEATELYSDLEADFIANEFFNNNNINLYRDGSISPYIEEMSGEDDYIFKNGRPLTEKQIEKIPSFEFIDFEIFELAIKGFNKLKAQNIAKKDILMVVDYRKHHSIRRLYVFDLKNKKVLYNTWTQNGFGTDPERTGYAQEFSNNPGSDQTSLGFMVTQETYYGRWGYSLRMKGMDKKLNSKVRSRAIVIHGSGALYAEGAVWGNMGLSQGCITLPIYESGKFYGLNDRPLNELIINDVKNGSVVFSYSDKINDSGSMIINSSDWL